MRAADIKGIPRIQIVGPEEFDAGVSHYLDVIPEQTGAFNIGHWGADNIECIKLFDGGDELARAAVIVKPIPLSRSGIAILKWGPMWRTKTDEPEWHIYQRVIQALREEYCTRRNFYLTVMPLADAITGEQCSTSLFEMGFAKGAALAAPNRYLVDTHQSVDALMGSFDQKWRYNLRKAMKNEFEIQIKEVEDGLPIFLKLYQEMITRKKFNDASAISSLEYFLRVAPNAIKPIVVIVYYEGKPTAGGVFFTAGEMASYMFGATDKRALKLKAGYAMHWWVAKFLCDQKNNKWYDLGGNDLDAGLHQFKRGMVGKTGQMLVSPPRFHYADSIHVSLIGRLVFGARDFLSTLKRATHSVKKNWIFR